MAQTRSRWLVAVTGTALIAAGCGSSSDQASTSVQSRPPVAAAEAKAVGVIRAWSNALRRGDVNAAARLFALPSEFVNGPGEVVTIHTEAQAQAVNATLPCGAVLISADRRGRFVSALFRLTERTGPNAGCGSGTGGLARTNFIIVGGRIVEWIRAPEGGGGVAPGPLSPTPQGGGPVV